MNLVKALFTVVVLLSCQYYGVQGYRILGLVPLHGKSHFVMAEALFKELARKGHQVDVVSHFPQKKPFHENYRDLSLAGSVPNIINNMTYNDFRHFVSFNMKRFAQLAGDPMCELLGHPVLQNLIKNPPKDPPYDVIIYEYFAANCYLVLSKTLNAPMIALVTAAWLDWLTVPFGFPYHPAYMPHAFSRAHHPMNFLQRLENTLLIPYISAQYHYYQELQMSYVHKYVGKEFTNIYDYHGNVMLLLVNSHHSLNGVKPFSPGIVEVGGLHIQEDETPIPAEVKKWLDSSSKHGCVYISFGSMVKIESFPKNVLDAFYETIKKMAPVRFLLKIAKKDELPPGLPNNAITYSWLPQSKILAHPNVKAFVTHGGLMGTLEAIRYAVPMIGFPLFGDQFVNINNYVNKKLAVQLDHNDLTSESFVKALNTVLNDPEYRESMNKISKLYWDRPMSPQDTAIYWIEYVIKYGNVLQSPARQMPWWKVAMVDVYALLVLVTILVIYILKFLITRFFKWFCYVNLKEMADARKKRQ